MSKIKRLRFAQKIAAPPQRVWDTMLGAESYRAWTAVFAEGSYFEGDWDQGSRIHFLAPGGDGMVAEIAESRPAQFVSIRHLGFVQKGVEDTASDAVKAWAPAYENYSFVPVDGGTQVIVDQDVLPEYEAYMNETWPKALASLRALCEDDLSG